jgi:hypothetical protein
MKRKPTLSSVRVHGIDPNGIPRVFGYGDMEEDARREAMYAAADYVKRRPDTLPLEKWNFVPGETK